MEKKVLPMQSTQRCSLCTGKIREGEFYIDPQNDHDSICLPCATAISTAVGDSIGGTPAWLLAPIGRILGKTSKLLTSQSKYLLSLAEDHAARLNNGYVASEHLLLAMLDIKGSRANILLGRFNPNTSSIKKTLRLVKGTAPQYSPDEPILYVPRVRMILQLGARAADDLRYPYLNTLHILLGIARERDGLAAQTMGENGVNLKQLDKKIMSELKNNRSKLIASPTLA